MCHLTVLEVTLKDDIDGRLRRSPAPRPFVLDGDEGWLRCIRVPPFRAGDTRLFWLGNGGCGCGVWKVFGVSDDGCRGEFLPVSFLTHFLSMEAVAYVGFLWLGDPGLDPPLEPPQRWLSWSEFLRSNSRGQLRERTRYLIADSRSELSRTWLTPGRAYPSSAQPDLGLTVKKEKPIVVHILHRFEQPTLAPALLLRQGKIPSRLTGHAKAALEPAPKRNR